MNGLINSLKTRRNKIHFLSCHTELEPFCKGQQFSLLEREPNFLAFSDFKSLIYLALSLLWFDFMSYLNFLILSMLSVNWINL